MMTDYELLYLVGLMAFAVFFGIVLFGYAGRKIARQRGPEGSKAISFCQDEVIINTLSPVRYKREEIAKVVFDLPPKKSLTRTGLMKVVRRSGRSRSFLVECVWGYEAMEALRKHGIYAELK